MTDDLIEPGEKLIRASAACSCAADEFGYREPGLRSESRAGRCRTPVR